MAAGFAATLFAAIVCSFLWSISYPPAPSGRPVVEHNHAAPNTERQPPGDHQSSASSIPSAITLIPAPKSKAEAEREEQERHEKAANERGLAVATWVLAYATALLFFAASVQAGLFVWQLSYMREGMKDATRAALAAQESVELARKTYVAEHRTWLKVYVTEIGPITIKDGKMRMTVAIEAENIGENPAINVNLECQMFVGKGYGAGPEEIKKALEMAKIMAAAGNRGVDLLPGEKTSIQFTADAETTARMAAATKSQIEAGVLEKNLPTTITAAYCVIYRCIASDEWGHAAHVVWINEKTRRDFDWSDREIPTDQIKGRIISGESHFA